MWVHNTGLIRRLLSRITLNETTDDGECDCDCYVCPEHEADSEAIVVAHLLGYEKGKDAANARIPGELTRLLDKGWVADPGVRGFAATQDVQEITVTLRAPDYEDRRKAEVEQLVREFKGGE